MAEMLQVLRYYDLCAELGPDMAGVDTPRSLTHEATREALAAFVSQAGELMMQVNPDTQPFSSLSSDQQHDFQATYREIRGAVLEAGVGGHLAIEDMEQLLRQLSTLRRVVEHASKAAALLALHEVHVDQPTVD